MKKRVLLFTAVAAFAFVILKSDSNGPGGNYTGSSGGTAGCTNGGGCHASSATSGIKLGVILDSAGIPVTKYIGGLTYTIVITDTNTTTSTLPKYGFECSVVKGSGSSSTQAGTWGTLPTGTSSHTTGGRVIWGHNTRLSPASGTGGTGTVYIDSVKWTAPAVGSGTVTVFSVMNDVNVGPSGADAGDLWNNTSVSFAERVVTPAGVATVANSLAINAFPNPAVNMLNVQLNNAAGTYSIMAYDLAGNCIASQEVTANGTTTATINTTNWSTGMYQVVVSNDGDRKVIPVVKR